MIDSARNPAGDPPVRGCWLCGSGEADEFLPAMVGQELTSDDFKISDSHYGRTARIVQCKVCGFRYADPLPSDTLVNMYAELVDPEYAEGSEGRIRPFRRILDRCRLLAPEARTVLDIGAGTGLMCVAARERGLEAVGVEPSKWAVEVASNENDVSVLEGIFPHPQLQGRRFGIITVVDVIEHVSDPSALLRDVSAAMAPGAILAVTTPDVRSLAARLMGRKWWHYRVAHVCYFDRKTMRRALHDAGLDLARVETYSWSFSIGYIAERLERYLPTGPLRRALSRTRLGRLGFSLNVPVNLRDSLTFYARER